jgi:hypothetical protein
LDGSRVILNPKKITIGFLERKMVEDIVLKDGVTTDHKFDKISKFPFPTTKRPFEVFWDGGLLLKVHTHVCNQNMSFDTILVRRCNYTNAK